MRELTPAVEDYLKAIYEVDEETAGAPAGTAVLADKLGVARASVTGMLKKLAAGPERLVPYPRYHGVRLPPKGRPAAREVVRHHRLLEAYLTSALGFSWDEVHAEADHLEHVISEDLEERIAAYLGHPAADPHGAPIPNCCAPSTASACALPAGCACWSADRSTDRCTSRPSTLGRSFP